MIIPTIPPLSLLLIMLGVVLLMAAIIVRRRLKRALPASQILRCAQDDRHFPTGVALYQPVGTEGNQSIPLDVYAEQQEEIAAFAAPVSRRAPR